MLEGLRLGHASVCMKIGNFNLKSVENLARSDRTEMLRIEVASPPHQQVGIFNPEINPFAVQDQAKPLGLMSYARKDVIGPRQEVMARPGKCDQSGDPYHGARLVDWRGSSGSTGTSTWP